MTGRKFIALLLLLAAFPCRQACAIQLGDSREEIEALHDTAPVGDHPKGIAIYRWDFWKLEIHYVSGAAHELIYTKLDALSDVEIRTLLDQNGGISHWHATASVNNREVAWARSDGATAVFDQASRRAITLDGGRMPAAGVPAPVAAVSQPQPVKPVIAVTAVKAAPTAEPAPPVEKKKEAVASTPSALPTHRLLSAIVADWKRVVIILAVFAVLGIVVRRFSNFFNQPAKKPRAYPFPKRADSGLLPKGLYVVPTLESMEWQQFELLMGEVYRRKGFKVEISSGDGADGGADLRLRKEGALVLAQCKHYRSGKVGVQEVREFYGVITAENAARGIFINTSIFTPDALDFAVGKRMLELLDGDAVKQLISSVTKPGENIYDIQQWLPDFIANATITPPTCQFCKSPMVLRSPKDRDGKRFWGCSGFPQCAGTRKARLELIGA